MAVRIAIVEDEKSAARVLEQAIQRYGTENKVFVYNSRLA